MKRALFLVPADLDFSALTDTQQAAIQSVRSQWTLPMPGTLSTNDQQIVDGITEDSFDPAVMPSLGLNWTCIGLWSWDEQAPVLAVIQALDSAALLAHLPPTYDYDADGNVTATHPTVLHVPHGWSGQPQIQI